MCVSLSLSLCRCPPWGPLRIHWARPPLPRLGLPTTWPDRVMGLWLSRDGALGLYAESAYTCSEKINLLQIHSNRILAWSLWLVTHWRTRGARERSCARWGASSGRSSHTCSYSGPWWPSLTWRTVTGRICRPPAKSISLSPPTSRLMLDVSVIFARKSPP